MADEHIARKHWRCTLERAEKFVSKQFFSDINLYSRLYSNKAPLTAVTHFAAPGRITYKQAIRGEYSPVKVGDAFGPTWSTHWFKVTIDVPSEWAEKEVHLRWNSGSEAMVWKDGKPLQGLTGADGHQERTDCILSTCQASSERRYVLYIEMAANGMFGAGQDGLINPPDPARKYSLSMAEIAVFDPLCYQLLTDLNVIIDMAKHLPEGSPRSFDALYTANRIVNACDTKDRRTFEKAHEIAQEFFSQHNGTSQHQVYAVGNCHIDCAWLWPAAETVRKCGRSFATAVQLMKKYPDFKFACSQAQQLEWVKIHYPGLYEEIKKFVANGQFIPVGATWVEMDGNIPSGESFIRQFVVGQQFFKEEFGMMCKEFWLPDTFGYSAQLPQIITGCGIKFFLTQKLSWSLINKFPFSSFFWQGIDGSKCLTHFPPADTYESRGDAKDVLKTSSNLKNKGRVHGSMLLYGHGDGGGGPSEDMIEMLKRMEDVDGCPRVKLSSPHEFFTAVAKRDSSSLCTWVGELYLELHQGTFTTQAEIKSLNRRGEFLLHNAELVTSLVWALGGKTADLYPSQKLLKVWKLFLLNQFHDILPGTCIREAITEALEAYEVVKSTATEIFQDATHKLISLACKSTKLSAKPIIVNTLGWARDECVIIPDALVPNLTDRAIHRQTTSDGKTLVRLHADPYSIGPPQTASNVPVSVTENEVPGQVTLENEFVRVRLDGVGRVVSLVHKPSQREAIPCGSHGNQLVLFDDVPLFWDAWDVMPYYLETRKPIVESTKQDNCLRVLDRGPLRASVEFSLRISANSSLTQLVTLDASLPYVTFNTKVDWHENRKFLKVEFPVDVHSMNATYEIQFGHLQRPTHCNTSWDWAKYEVCGQRWCNLSEHNWGVSLMTDSKYGYSTHGSTMYISLLRSPKAPDNQSDMGRHQFAYAVFPHIGSFQDSGLIRHAQCFNEKLHVICCSVDEGFEKQSFFSVDNPAVVLETVKKAENVDALILRMYEAFGGKTRARLTTKLNVTKIQRVDQATFVAHVKTQESQTDHV
ncbi:alpha-mannosidase 2C1 isoform X2 [Nematostella vectensis]|uniref:alpha-mannosidase 2C1 isoform X2 n=1 Tax=Nematostella vectensis TaxID=45351 RepID=UPI0020778C6E|nr:alpha-mannosidase 2C1 isoform X2 [Nematostella vectensis]